VRMKIGILSLALAGSLSAQVSAPNPTQNPNPQVHNVSEGTPIYKVTVVSRTAQAVNYRHRGGATKINFRGTELMPAAKGEAKVESKKGYIEIEVEFDKMNTAHKYGPEFLTFVLWAVSPEGRATNLGEILLDSQGRGKLDVSTELQSFGMIVTAEPYYSVTQPSDVVVMENFIRADTLGKAEVIDARYELLKRGSYVFRPDESPVQNVNLATAGGGVAQDSKKSDIYLAEARNALQIARWTGAPNYSADTYNKANGLLQQAEDYWRRKQWKPASMTAREAVQVAEDSRLITLQRAEEERLANERRAAAEREAAERQKAEEARRQQDVAQQRAAEEAQRRAQADQARLAAEQERVAAERAKAEADVARAAAERAKADAVAQQQALAGQAEQSRLAAEQSRLAAEEAQKAAANAERGRLNAEAEKQALRDQIRQQLNTILETRESARGLIVNMSDVLFDFGKYTLKPGTREKLAKVSGIILAHPGLKIEVEGHTDSVGSEEFNQKLSEQRAAAVQDYLVGQGVPPNMVTARGFGKTQPVASNDTAEGRQRNRRVELVVSGEPIGKMSSSTPSNATTVPAAPAR